MASSLRPDSVVPRLRGRFGHPYLYAEVCPSTQRMLTDEHSEGAVALTEEQTEGRGRLALFAGIDGVRFKRIVEPGDELELTCDLERVRGPIGKGRAEARVDGQLAARGTLTFAVEQA